jgi:hypothetical protein
LKYWFRRADERGELFMRLVRDSGPLAARAKADQKANAEGWALGLQKAFDLPARQARQYAWFMVAGTAGALDARDGDDEALIDAITLAVVAGAKALAKQYAEPRPGKSA